MKLSWWKDCAQKYTDLILHKYVRMCVTYLQPYINWNNIHYIVVYQPHNNVCIEHTVVVKELKMSANDYISSDVFISHPCT